MALRREGAILELSDRFAARKKYEKRASVAFLRRARQQRHPLDRVQPDDVAPVLWQGDQA